LRAQAFVGSGLFPRGAIHSRDEVGRECFLSAREE
jgi:hypothetical protein